MSTLIETRAEFQQLADERLKEAKALLSCGKWGGAYYLAGYAVELALKACLIKRLMATDAFPAKDFSKDCYRQDLGTLLKLARLDAAFDASNATLKANWASTKDWSEHKRYHLITEAEAEAEARVLVNAIEDATHGVLPWVKTHFCRTNSTAVAHWSNTSSVTDSTFPWRSG